MNKKIYEQKKEIKKEFPYGRLVAGSVLGAWFSYYSPQNMQDFNNPFILYLIFAAVMCSIPMLVAYKRNIKKDELVYWLAFLSPWLPAGIVLCVIALGIAIFGKKLEK